MLLRYAILGLLDGQELHGYRIKSTFEERVGSSWPLNFGQIYQTLKDLRRRGLVEGRFDRGTGHVGRWVYTITAKGRRALDTWLARAPRRPQPARDEMLIRLLVLQGKDLASQLAQLDGQDRVYREHVAHLVAERRASGDDELLRSLASAAAAFQAEAHLRWLAHCAKVLKRRAADDAATPTRPGRADEPSNAVARRGAIAAGVPRLKTAARA